MWVRKLKHIEYENRWENCVINSNGEIIFYCTNLNIDLVDCIIRNHNRELSAEYKKGLYEGAEIRRESLEENK